MNVGTERFLEVYAETIVVWLSWWLHWLSVVLVIERSLVRLPAGALSSHLGQLSLPSLRGRQIEYQRARLGLRRGMFTCVG